MAEDSAFLNEDLEVVQGTAQEVGAVALPLIIVELPAQVGDLKQTAARWKHYSISKEAEILMWC